LLIELRIGARARHRPHVDHEIDVRLPQKVGKFNNRSGRMTYGEKGARGGSNE
jgi:hypothetical protein